VVFDSTTITGLQRLTTFARWKDSLILPHFASIAPSSLFSMQQFANVSAVLAEGWSYLAAFVEHTLLQQQRVIADVIQCDQVEPLVQQRGLCIYQWTIGQATCAALRSTGVQYKLELKQPVISVIPCLYMHMPLSNISHFLRVCCWTIS
jgi:hypothetical protein